MDSSDSDSSSVASPSSPASPQQTSAYRGEPSLERLVLHFVAAKKSLTATQHVYRATELASRGAVQMPRDGESLADAIRRAAASTPAAIDIDLNGAQRSLEILSATCA